MSPKAAAITRWLTALPAAFVLGVVWVGSEWKTSVDITNELQSDSIYVNAEQYDLLEAKYESLQEFCVQLQAVNRAQDAQNNTNTIILREIYYNQTGRDWGAE